jgi:hypothetical protein
MYLVEIKNQALKITRMPIFINHSKNSVAFFVLRNVHNGKSERVEFNQWTVFYRGQVKMD